MLHYIKRIYYWKNDTTPYSIDEIESMLEEAEYNDELFVVDANGRIDRLYFQSFAQYVDENYSAYEILCDRNYSYEEEHANWLPILIADIENGYYKGFVSYEDIEVDDSGDFDEVVEDEI